MSLNVNVQGGTGGGKKKPMGDKPRDWNCNCLCEDFLPCVCATTCCHKPGYLARCPDCKMERPT